MEPLLSNAKGIDALVAEVVSKFGSRSASSSEHNGFTWFLSLKQRDLYTQRKSGMLLDVPAYFLMVPLQCTPCL